MSKSKGCEEQISWLLVSQSIRYTITILTSYIIWLLFNCKNGIIKPLLFD